MDRTWRTHFCRLVSASGRTRAGKTVEAFGWLILAEGLVMLFAPKLVEALLHLPPLVEQSANYFRLIGVLVSGIGMLYVVSGRMGDGGFVFASLLDRPLVPFIMAALWYLGFVPGSLAVVFAVQDFGSFLWTLAVWRQEAAAPVESG